MISGTDKIGADPQWLFVLLTLFSNRNTILQEIIVKKYLSTSIQYWDSNSQLRPGLNPMSVQSVQKNNVQKKPFLEKAVGEKIE